MRAILLVLLAVIAGAMLCGTAAQPQNQTVSHGRFKDIVIYKPQGQVRQLALFLSDRDGWNATTAKLAQALTDEGVLRAVHGRDIGHSEVATGAATAFGHAAAAVRLIDELGRLVAIAEPTKVPGVLHPAVVLR